MTTNESASSESFLLYERVADTYEKLYYTDSKLALEKPFLDKLLSVLPSHPKVLDLGCGTAVEAQYLIDSGADYTGVDASESMIAIARRHTRGGQFILSDISETLPVESNSFDGVIALDSLIHFSKAQIPDILNGVSKVLTKNGGFLLAVEAGYGEQMLDFGLGLDNKVLVSLYTLEEISALLRQAHFDVYFSATRPLMEGEFPFPQLYLLARMEG